MAGLQAVGLKATCIMPQRSWWRVLLLFLLLQTAWECLLDTTMFHTGALSAALTGGGTVVVYIVAAQCECGGSYSWPGLKCSWRACLLAWSGVGGAYQCAKEMALQGCSLGGAQNVSVASEVDDRLQLRYGLQLITLMGCSSPSTEVA